MREYGSQAVVWQTALNPVIALELLATGTWNGTGVLGRGPSMPCHSSTSSPSTTARSARPTGWFPVLDFRGRLPLTPVMSANGSTPVVQLEGVRKSFGDLVVLDGVDLSVTAGEVLVIIGASGSGKSTLLRCVNLLEPVDSGRILLEGVELTRKGADVSTVRQRIGIVFQQFNLFPHLKVIDNLTLAARRIRRSRRPRPRSGRSSCCAASGWRRRRASIRTSSPAGSNSASPSPGR